MAEQLHAEFPSIKTFVTLSPIPGFMDWVAAGANLGDGVPADRLKPSLKAARDAALACLKLDTQSWTERLAAGWHPDLASEKEKEALLCLASIYLGLASTGRDGNPVAKFHLGNGYLLCRLLDTRRKKLTRKMSVLGRKKLGSACYIGTT